MDDLNYPKDTPAPSAHFSIALLAVAVAVFVGAQIVATNQGGKTMEWQLETGTKQLDNLKKNEKDLDDLIAQREELVKQAAGVQAQYTNILQDVLDLSKDDEDAKKVIQKYNIQRNQAQNAPAPAPAPATDKR